MPKFFTRQRFGRPQFLAGALLLAFLAQALWLVRCEFHTPDSRSANGSELVRLTSGWRQLHHGAIAGAPYPDSAGTLPPEISIDADNYDTEHSPLLSIVTAAPLLLVPQQALDQAPQINWRWLPRLPFLLFGVLLGASLWYVARRLCGNHGGFLALTLYCFSPAMLQAAAVWHTEPEILAAWGSFGAIFTAIAVSHTLYAPREVVLWNWRRIVLLGIALAISIASQFSMIVVVPIALAFMLYLAPIRRAAALTIGIASCMVALVILFATYSFQPHAFSEGLRHASFLGATWRGFTVPAVYREVTLQILRACPAFILMIPIAIATYALWPRTRYFGNTAPLLVALLFVALGIAHPHVAAAGFLLASVPFIFIFVSGILADLMETSFRPVITASIWALVGAYVLRSLLALSQIPLG
jgi:hypothetical protein